jgi:hypothetical protein
VSYKSPNGALYPYLAYERGPEGLPALGSLETTHTSLLWTLEPGSKRELLFLAFMMEFMPPPAAKPEQEDEPE